MTQTWQFYSLLSACFAAMTAIFGKVGVTEVNSNLATWIRVIVILGFSTILIFARGEFRELHSLSSWGLLFLGEVPTFKTILGGVLIWFGSRVILL